MSDKKTTKKPPRVGDGTPGPGRPKGSPNKTTVAVKHALGEAFHGLGGVDTLIQWGIDNRTEFYKLWVKMLPTEISGPDGGPIRTESTEALSALPKEKRDALRVAIQKAME